jgi:cytochrome c
MKAVLVGIVVVVFAVGASLKELNAAPLVIDLDRGKAIYSSVCAICHGTDGKGGADKVHSSGRRPHVPGDPREAGCEFV